MKLSPREAELGSSTPAGWGPQLLHTAAVQKKLKWVLLNHCTHHPGSAPDHLERQYQGFIFLPHCIKLKGW